MADVSHNSNAPSEDLLLSQKPRGDWYQKKPCIIKPVQAVRWFRDGNLPDWAQRGSIVYSEHAMLRTQDGMVRADPGDWIIREVNGDVSVWDNASFAEDFEHVSDEPPAKPAMNLTFHEWYERHGRKLEEQAAQRERECPTIRRSVMAFAKAMEMTLRKHDAAKGGQNGKNGRSGWRKDPMWGLIQHAESELSEVKDAYAQAHHPGGVDALAAEAIDLANMAMMVWDNCLRLPEATDPS